MKRVTLALAATLTLTGCATKDYVNEQVKPVDDRVQALESRTGSRLDAIEARLKAHDDRLVRHDAELAELSRTAREALERANAAGKLNEGRLVYEVVLTDDTLKFQSDSSSLSRAGMQALDAFVARLKGGEPGVYLEIQGHTDSRGSEAYNLILGQGRAEAVRRYLHAKGGIPLSRMAAISYGESEPVASNMNQAGREQNRRVVLVVLK